MQRPRRSVPCPARSSRWRLRHGVIPSSNISLFRMKEATKGAWIIHHANKISSVTNAAGDFEQLNFAGKCGTLLSALSVSDDIGLEDTKVAALAKAAGISVLTELPTILGALEEQKLISRGKKGIDVLGLTTATTLEHTAKIFDSIDPSPAEKAAISLSDLASEMPVEKKQVGKKVADACGLKTDEISDFLTSAEQIGFVDAERVDASATIYFNGNLFRKNDAKKMLAVVASLTNADAAKVTEFNQQLTTCGCVTLEAARKVLGVQLFEKLQAIGAYDVNQVGNEQGRYAFVTHPASFKKFADSTVEDAFDFAKAFVASLTYGMTMSAYSRGRITMIKALMQKLIAGHWIGPATAIGHDYKVLELKHVVEVRPHTGGMYNMRLLKREVGEIALQVILEGEASSQMLSQIPGASVTTFTAPEPLRAYKRKNQTEPMKKEIGKLLTELRTGRI